jgi:hypothetical protein
MILPEKQRFKIKTNAVNTIKTQKYFAVCLKKQKFIDTIILNILPISKFCI